VKTGEQVLETVEHVSPTRGPDLRVLDVPSKTMGLEPLKTKEKRTVCQSWRVRRENGAAWAQPGVDDAADAGSVSMGPPVPLSSANDRDAIYGGDWVAMTKGLGMEEVISAPRSPWQNPYVERLIGSIRRECLDHIIVWNERSLRRTLKDYFAYYQRSRTHLALAKDAPESRVVEKPESGRIVAIPQLGGLHHRYQRRAA
jgi:hypothetical protein